MQHVSSGTQSAVDLGSRLYNGASNPYLENHRVAETVEGERHNLPSDHHLIRFMNLRLGVESVNGPFRAVLKGCRVYKRDPGSSPQDVVWRCGVFLLV